MVFESQRPDAGHLRRRWHRRCVSEPRTDPWPCGHLVRHRVRPPSSAWSGSSDADTGLYATGHDSQLVALDLHAGPRLVNPQAADSRPGRGLPLVGEPSRRDRTAVARADGRSDVPLRITDLDTGADHRADGRRGSRIDAADLSLDDAADRLLMITQDRRAVLHVRGVGRAVRARAGSVRPRRACRRPTTWTSGSSPRTAAPPCMRSPTIDRRSTHSPGSSTARVRRCTSPARLLNGTSSHRLRFAPDGRALVNRLRHAAPEHRPAGIEPGRATPSATAPENQLVGVVDLRTWTSRRGKWLASGSRASPMRPRGPRTGSRL